VDIHRVRDELRSLSACDANTVGMRSRMSVKKLVGRLVAYVEKRSYFLLSHEFLRIPSLLDMMWER
jgi:hypothetical protein